MANFNVFVPARKGSDMPDLTLKVEASNWLVALKESLKRIGEQGDALANIVCETAPDGSIRVADPGSRRVFVIAKVDSARDAEFEKEADRRAAESRSIAKAAEQAHKETAARLKDVESRISAAPTAPVETPVPAAETVPIISATPAAAPPAPAVDETARRLEDEKRRLEAELAEAKATLEAAARKAAEEATGVLGRVEVERVEKKLTHKEAPAVKAKARSNEWGDLDDWYDGVDTSEETIDGVVSDLFLATSQLHEKNESESALEVLKLAAKYVTAEAASIFYSDMNSALKDLVIVAASGPVGNKIIGIRVPLGKGIVGFSVINGVKLIVNSVDRNPNFYGKLDQEFGFKTHSILCVPIQHGDRTYGAIEVINKRGEDATWTTNDANVLESLAKILGRAVETSIQARKE